MAAPRPSASITLLEITIALSILLVGLVPLIGMFSTNAAISQKQSSYLQAMNILDATLSHVVSQGYGGIRDASPTELLDNCLIQVREGSKPWSSVTSVSKAGGVGFVLKGDLATLNTLYQLELDFEILFAGNRDSTALTSARPPFVFHFSVYTKPESDYPGYWDIDPDFENAKVPVVYVKRSETTTQTPVEVRYKSPERIYCITGKITWTERPNNVVKEIILVTYKTDLTL